MQGARCKARRDEVRIGAKDQLWLWETCFKSKPQRSPEVQNHSDRASPVFIRLFRTKRASIIYYQVLAKQLLYLSRLCVTVSISVASYIVAGDPNLKMEMKTFLQNKAMMVTISLQSTSFGNLSYGCILYMLVLIWTFVQQYGFVFRVPKGQASWWSSSKFIHKYM